jgi:hypothetical protein
MMERTLSQCTWVCAHGGLGRLSPRRAEVPPALRRPSAWHRPPRPRGLLAAAAGLLTVLRTQAVAGDAASHVVTVQVTPVSAVELVGGGITLTLEGVAKPARPPAPAEDATCSLRWRTNESNQRVTVRTTLVAPAALLSVTAEDVTGGTPTGEVALSTTDHALVVSVRPGPGGCTLRYRAAPRHPVTEGQDVHTVTYTITATP